jgi:heme exporter protein A
MGRMLLADGLAAIRGERLVFREVSFAVQSGGALVLTGANGSGKSTLLRLLAGLGRLATGRLLWDGADALVDLPTHARRVAYLGHLDAIKLGLTAKENLRFAAATGSGCGIAAALDAMALGELAELPARLFSAGQRRRLALARLLLSPAPLWLLDEPTLGLDAAATERLGPLFAAQRGAGGLVVAATHVPLPLPDAAELHLG